MEYNLVLRMFLDTISQLEIIHDYVQTCSDSYQHDPLRDMALLHDKLNRQTPCMGNTRNEEVAHIHQLLTYISEQNESVIKLANGTYSISTKFMDILDDFNNRVVIILILHIQDYLNEIGISMGLDEHTIYNVSVNNETGQSVVVVGGSNVNVSQTNGINLTELHTLLQTIREKIPETLSKEDSEVITDSLDTINSELESATPRKGLLRTAIKGLTTVKNSVTEAVEFSSAIGKLINFVTLYLS